MPELARVMDQEAPRRPRRSFWQRLWRRKWLLALMLLALLAAAAIFGVDRYRRWQVGRLIIQADQSFHQSDYRGASLSLQRALQIDPHHAQACRWMATLHEKGNSPAAIAWRRRVVELQPDSATDRLALASIALRFNNTALAQQTLDGLPEPARGTVAYRTVAAFTALATGRRTAAEEHLAEALKLEPQNEAIELQLALLRAQSSAPAVRDQGLASLLRLRSSPASRPRALRALLDDAVKHQVWPRAVSLALELQAEPGATWADQIACLDVHQRGAHPNFAVQLGRLQTVAASDPPRVLALVHWMNANGLAERVLEWSRELPAKVTAEPPISGVLAESCLAVKDWGTMRKLVAGGNWGPLEFMRHAFNARLLRADAQAADAGLEWNAALKAAGRQTAALRALARVAESWGMTAEADQVLWGLARGPQEDATWALGRLLQRAQAAGDTHGLFRVLGRLIELHPADDQARNNWAMIAMLLKLDLSRAREMARDLHARHPGDALFASTHAFALHSQGHTADALAVMSSFPEPQLQTPAIAAYHGVFLAAAGKKTEAAKYFRHSEGAKLLPEEQALIAEARKAAL